MNSLPPHLKQNNVFLLDLFDNPRPIFGVTQGNGLKGPVPQQLPSCAPQGFRYGTKCGGLSGTYSRLCDVSR